MNLSPNPQSSVRDQAMGVALILGIAFLCGQLSSLVEVGGKHPLEASALAVVLGIGLRNLIRFPEKLMVGVKHGDALLIWGIVFLGAGLDFSLIFSQGIQLLVVILLTMTLGLVSIFTLGRIFGLSSQLSVLLAAGTSICGTSAIAVIAPIVKAKQSETSYAIGTVALLGVLSVLLYPLVGRVLGVSDYAFGVFAGTAIHSTPQVVGAAITYSALSGQIATAVKLVRNCFIAPVAFVLAGIERRRGGSIGEVDVRRAFPWFLFCYFALAGVASLKLVSVDVLNSAVDLGKFLVVVGMVSIGLETDLQAFRELGAKPLFVGTTGTAIVAAFSAGLVWFLF